MKETKTSRSLVGVGVRFELVCVLTELVAEGTDEILIGPHMYINHKTLKLTKVRAPAPNRTTPTKFILKMVVSQTYMEGGKMKSKIVFQIRSVGQNISNLKSADCCR